MQHNKIVHLTSVHPRYDTRIFLKMCTSLAANNYQVSLVVADGKGYEQKNNVTIYDVGASKGRFDRIRNGPKRVLKKAIELDADLYHLHDPELILIGLKLKKLGKKVIFDIHENTDLQIFTKEWIPFYLRKSISLLYIKFERFTLPKFDFLVVPQIAMQTKFSKLAPTELLANFPSEVLDLEGRTNLSKYNLLYSGGLSESRGLFNMLDLIYELSKLDKSYQLTLAGPITISELEKAESHPGWKNTKYLGVLNKDDIYKEYKNNSIGLILFNNIGQYYMSYSLKLFEYMQSGILVLMPNFGDWLQFNSENEVGFNVATQDAKKIAKLIHGLTGQEIQNFSKHNINLAAQKFMWQSEEVKLFKLYEELIYGTKF